MIFKGEDIEVDNSYMSCPAYVNANRVIERVEKAILDKLAFERDYDDAKWLYLEDAEEFIIEMHRLIKKFENQ